MFPSSPPWRVGEHFSFVENKRLSWDITKDLLCTSPVFCSFLSRSTVQLWRELKERKWIWNNNHSYGQGPSLIKLYLAYSELWSINTDFFLDSLTYLHCPISARMRLNQLRKFSHVLMFHWAPPPPPPVGASEVDHCTSLKQKPCWVR